jgi:type VI secretion system secreted protein VgrG
VSAVGYVADRYPITLKVPTLSSTALLVMQMDGEESISGLYEFRLRLVAEDAALDFTSIVGKDACLSIALPSEDPQFVHGVIGRFRQAGTNARVTTYFADLHSRFGLLTKTRDSRIFQNQSTPDIVKAVLQDNGVIDISETLTGSYEAHEYCVQYQESAFTFVSRLLENEGIAYRFDHTDSAHTLVITDDVATSQPPLQTLSIAASVGAWERTDAMGECILESEVIVGRYKADDYNFETPTTDLLGVASGDDPTLTVYEYPAARTSKSAVEALANQRLQALEMTGRLLRGESNNPAIRPGRRFQLQDHPRDDANVEYVVRRVSHQGDQSSYSNAFEAFPISSPFRPVQTTPAPRIHGCQTAVVVGKAGEEITTDQYGRVKVKFHWDQAAPTDETSSCWIRVAQTWAGKQWGTFFLPRIGQEVVVTFLEGNPDRPLVTGSVYNAAQLVPYGLPDNQTRSTIRSDSSKGGGGANEIRFEDKKGEEEVFIQAQKDMNVSVLNDQAITVANARTVTVQKADDILKVEKGNRTIEIAGKEARTVKGDRTLTITGSETHDNSAGLTYTIKDDVSLTIGGKLVVKVTGDATFQVTGNVTIQSTGDLSQKATGSHSTESAQSITVKAGMSLTQEAGVSLTSKAGATQTVEAGAMLALKGALVKVN